MPKRCFLGRAVRPVPGLPAQDHATLGSLPGKPPGGDKGYARSAGGTNSFCGWWVAELTPTLLRAAKLAATDLQSSTTCQRPDTVWAVRRVGQKRGLNNPLYLNVVVHAAGFRNPATSARSLAGSGSPRFASAARSASVAIGRPRIKGHSTRTILSLSCPGANDATFLAAARKGHGGTLGRRLYALVARRMGIQASGRFAASRSA